MKNQAKQHLLNILQITKPSNNEKIFKVIETTVFQNLTLAIEFFEFMDINDVYYTCIFSINLAIDPSLLVIEESIFSILLDIFYEIELRYVISYVGPNIKQLHVNIKDLLKISEKLGSI